MTQLMPNGFEEYEIRYAPFREGLCESLARKFFGKDALAVLGIDGLSMGLLALCLFLVSEDHYAVYDNSSFAVILLKLGHLQPSTLILMYAELEDQRRLFPLLAKLPNKD